jgi:hypothetical protein
MDLIRQILFKVEAHPEGFAPRELHIDGGYTQAQIGYHIWLLGDAKLMAVSDVTSHGSTGPYAIPLNLTSLGHDFIDSARNDTVWSHAKEKVKTVGGSVSLAIFQQVLNSLVKSTLGM